MNQTMPQPAKKPLPVAPVATAPEPPAESADLFDYALIRDYAGFVMRSARRHKLVALAAFLAVSALGISTLVLLPKTYQVQTRILAQRNAVMSTLSNPYLPRPFDFDVPTRAARETVLRRDNLLALIEQTDFARRYLEHRAPAVWLRDWVTTLISRDRTKDEFIDSLVDTLEKRLSVDVGDGLVTITFYWSDKETAVRMVEAALQNFLEVRHASEISTISDAIGILESHVDKVEKEIGATVQQVVDTERALRNRTAPPAARPVPVVRAVAPREPGKDEEVSRLQSQLTAKRRAIVDLEEFRQRRLAELQAQLTQYQAIYTDRHPAVLAVQQNIDAIAGPSPQIDALRNEAVGLEREIVVRGGLPGPQVREPSHGPIPRAEITTSHGIRDDDPRIEYERGQLRLLFNKYNALRERIDGARVELDTTQAAFKYRYSVITPPQMPRKPLKPNAIMVVVASLLGGVLFAFFAAAAGDLRSGRLVERWQIERRLDLPVLAEIRK